MAENIPPPLPRHANQEPHVLPETRLEQETKRPPAEQRPEKETKKAPVESKKDERKPIKQEHTEEYDEMANPYDLAGYEKISKIGEGTYGVVFKAKQKETNKLVALKKIRLNLQEGVPTTTIREVAILKEMDHKNIVRLVDMIQRDATIYLVFDYSEVDLRRYMDKARRPGLTANHIKSFMHQLLLGLHYCHSHRILHRDLKPQNLLIDKYGRLTIADLGLSRAFGVPMRTYTHQVITLWYRAPEILLGSRHYSTAVDMWSVGCIMAEMITLRALFPGSTQIDELFRIFQVLGTPTEAMWPGITTLPDYNEHFPPWKPRDLKETIEEYPHSIKDLPDSAYDLLRSLLSYDPVTRISAARAEEHMYFYDDITMLAL
ncbi:kinase-like domain-containing protein [Gilbertella persicaria]|uniref:kinase-like domain-containing protein n=1 Tax=Gilbertella persicaria TaxID=101096 RepID=UPI00221ED789|nr:kinase-like domain-containing protein [Gilbertella persicaria]KAI8091453.1 kinase-like domain-containing protein [Gilbertella persicaria]